MSDERKRKYIQAVDRLTGLTTPELAMGDPDFITLARGYPEHTCPSFGACEQRRCSFRSLCTRLTQRRQNVWQI
ncbi:MAG TPA: hypothetical protein VFF68_01025 [Anaerolineaceae bacterium]|nr:hypothetical protein [Anaerolineaceae bacterium]